VARTAGKRKRNKGPFPTFCTIAPPRFRGCEAPTLVGKKAVKADVAPDCKRRHSVAFAKRNTIMTNIENIQTKVLSDAELDSVAGGFVPNAIKAMEIYKVEHEHLPTVTTLRLIHEIEMGRIRLF
jgi:hypothetical protein